MNPWLAGLCLHLPQAILLVYTGPALFGTRLKGRVVFGISVTLAIVLSALRSVPALYGWHTVLTSVAYLFLVTRIGGISLVHALVGLSAGYVLLAVGEAFITVPFLKAVGLSIEQSFQSTWLYILSGWLAQLPLSAAAALAYARAVVIFRFPAVEPPREREGE